MQSETKRVLIVSPHFPPINAPDHQRVRMALPYFKEFGWDATVLAVDAKYVEGIRDPLLEKTIPVDTAIVRTRALPPKWTRFVGLGSLALRALTSLRREGSRLLAQEPKFDLIFFSTTMFPTLVLGPFWKRKFDVPYIVDYQDPWISDYYDRSDQTPPGGRVKYWFSGVLARVLEPRVVRAADEFVVVSPKYTEDLMRTYPFLHREQFTTLPFGAPERDFELLSKLRGPAQPVAAKTCLEIAYVGAAGPFMATPLRVLFSAVARSREKNAPLWANIRFRFIGTSYAPTGRALKAVSPIAAEFDVDDLVEEQTDRLPYFDALDAIRNADGLLIIGSESASYSPSKIYPYLLARRPTLAILHRESPVVDILRRCKVETIVQFGRENGASNSEIDDDLARFIRNVQSNTAPTVDWGFFSNYSAREMTRQLAAGFDRVVRTAPVSPGSQRTSAGAGDQSRISSHTIGVLFGHPTGNPNAHQAALAHYERGRLDEFCVSWIPTQRQIDWLRNIPGLHDLAARIERRIFPPLLNAPVIQSRYREWGRILKRVVVGSPLTDEAMAYDANDWLMRTMAHECRRPSVDAVHSYEDCSLLQFEEAKRLGKMCIYDMPIGYYPVWAETQRRLATEFREWLPAGGLHSERYVRPLQKQREMELADLVLGPSTFVRGTIPASLNKKFALAPYGVDSEFWRPGNQTSSDRPLRFIYAGQATLRKGTPLLLKAWELAALQDAELVLVGSWQLATSRLRQLPPNVRYLPPCSAAELRKHYQAADIFVFPSYFEGFGLVLLEAMACGLPVISSECTAAPDFLTAESGWIIPVGELEAWVAALREVSGKRNELFTMKQAAREVALANTWKRYRDAVSDAVTNLFS